MLKFKDVKEFRVKFNQVDATYEPGDNVSGQVFLRLTSSIRIKGRLSLKYILGWSDKLWPQFLSTQ